VSPLLSYFLTERFKKAPLKKLRISVQNMPISTNPINISMPVMNSIGAFGKIIKRQLVHNRHLLTGGNG
jgi:hypothetical protein